METLSQKQVVIEIAKVKKDKYRIWKDNKA